MERHQRRKRKKNEEKEVEEEFSLFYLLYEYYTPSKSELCAYCGREKLSRQWINYIQLTGKKEGENTHTLIAFETQ